ncbi:hypothetical protein GEMRC1_000540 [Eukaryota sp. GEM-RC1]
MTLYTSYPSSKMHSPYFETAVMQIQKDRELVLGEDEKASVSCFKEVKPSRPLNTDGMYFEEKMKLQELERLATGQYIDLQFIPATSNDIERFFSKAKNTLSDGPNLTSHCFKM